MCIYIYIYLFIYIYICRHSACVCKIKQRMIFKMHHAKVPYYQWANVGLWTFWIDVYICIYIYICMYRLSYHSTTTHWNICIWCVKNCKDIPCLHFCAICSCIPGQGLKALNPSPENWTARHNGKETTVSLSADLAQEPLCQIPRRCHWFLVLDLKKIFKFCLFRKSGHPTIRGIALL